MSKIKKTICDNCQKEINWYLEARIIRTYNDSDIGAVICDGDYCRKCFKEKVGEIPEWEE